MASENSADLAHYNDGHFNVTPSSAELYEASPAITVLLAFFYGAISLLALVGNGLVVIIITGNKRMQSVTNFLLANLAASDILIGVAAVPFQFQAALLQRWVLPHFLCIVAPFVQVLSVNVSIFTLTIISIERYRALLYPFKSRISKRSASYAIAIIWICGVVCAAPMAATLRVELLDDPYSHSGKKDFCYPSGLATPFNDSIKAVEDAMVESRRIFGGYVVFLVVVQFVAPLLIISFAYTSIAVHLWGSHLQQPGEAHIELNSARTKQRQKVIKMLIVVVALFAFCWFPLQLYNFLTVVVPVINEYPYINIVWFCCNFLAMSNSCQNPFILGFCNEKFRQELRGKISLTCLSCEEKRDGANQLSDYSGVPPRPDETDYLVTLAQTTRVTNHTSVHNSLISHAHRRGSRKAARTSSAGKRYAQQHLTGIPHDSPVHLTPNSSSTTATTPAVSNGGGKDHLTVNNNNHHLQPRKAGSRFD